ncbi:MAG TPA: carboxyl transferase domain-containing protein, partial [Clostridia bacterium]|nr:carboxyl transferase domain-containing protein [Clostridia bacterium]
MLKDLFGKKKYATVMLYKDNDNKIRTVAIDNFEKVSEKTSNNDSKGPGEISHPRMAARDRINSTIDKGTFVEYDTDLKTIDALNFPGYMEKVEIAMQNSGEKEAVITGEGKIMGENCVICVMDSNFMMGSMGSV